MKGFLVSAVENMGRAVVKTVEVVQSKRRKRGKKMKGFTKKAAEFTKDVFEADDTDDIKEEFETRYKRDTSGMDEKDAQEIREEDAERFERDSEAIGESKARAAGVVGAAITTLVITAGVAAGVVVMEMLNIRDIRDSAARKTAMWNATH